ncbi:MAG: hypothetical protein ACFCGT_19835 [Sandaracinaceae bacterium]
MGISLAMQGRREGSEPDAAWLEQAAAWWRLEHDAAPRPVVDVAERGLHVALHPAAEDLEVALDDGGRAVTLRAKTGTAGPGYHRHVVQAARAFGDALRVAWSDVEDPTGHAQGASPDAVEATLHGYLQEVARSILDLQSQGASGFALHMPSTHAFRHDGLIATPLGPRDESWVRRVVADPTVAEDIFPWWGPERDAAYFRGRALSLLWTEVRWRPPVVDAERALLDEAATLLERAYALDPDGDYPWAAWAELYTHLEEDSLRATRTRLRAGPVVATIGYRRSPVQVALTGGFSLVVDGSLAERWEEQGTWVAWDHARSVWFTSLTCTPGPDGQEPTTEETLAGLPPAQGEGEQLSLSRGPLRGRAVISEAEADGQRVYRLEAQAAIGASAAVGTLVYVQPEDREWALSTWGTLDHPDLRAAEGG